MLWLILFIWCVFKRTRCCCLLPVCCFLLLSCVRGVSCCLVSIGEAYLSEITSVCSPVHTPSVSPTSRDYETADNTGRCMRACCCCCCTYEYMLHPNSSSERGRFFNTSMYNKLLIEYTHTRGRRLPRVVGCVGLLKLIHPSGFPYIQSASHQFCGVPRTPNGIVRFCFGRKIRLCRSVEANILLWQPERNVPAGLDGKWSSWAYVSYRMRQGECPRDVGPRAYTYV